MIVVRFLGAAWRKDGFRVFELWCAAMTPAQIINHCQQARLTFLGFSAKCEVTKSIICTKGYRMNKMLPWQHDSRLSQERLAIIAQAFLDVYYAVEEGLSTPDDCGYTRGTTFFGRARNRLIAMGQSDKYPWLSLTNPAMDVTCEIEGLPFRFFRDDHENPKKKGFWRRNACDQLFASDENTPVVFRFVVEIPIIDDDPPEIYFIGYNSTEIAVTEWRYGQVPVLRSQDEHTPKPVTQAPAPVDLPCDDVDWKDDTGSLQ